MAEQRTSMYRTPNPIYLNRKTSNNYFVQTVRAVHIVEQLSVVVTEKKIVIHPYSNTDDLESKLQITKYLQSHLSVQF